MNAASTPLAAQLLIAPGCPHCETQGRRLMDAVKQGVLGRLEIINLAAHPEVAEQWGVRSVPWTQIGPFRFQGAMEVSAIRDWAGQAVRTEGPAAYLRHLIEENQVEAANAWAEDHPETWSAVAAWLGEPDTPMTLRIGLQAWLESRADEGLDPLLPHLIELTHHTHPSVRADAVYLLGLSLQGGAAQDDTLSALQACLDDPFADVREIAAEALEPHR